MAPPKEESDTAPLPRPELNPLLNPLLAENMGRWAEVYFTAAPEKREEAVGELLRELESGEPSTETAVKSQAGRAFQDAGFPVPDFSAEDFTGKDRQSRGHCHACHHDNPSTHQFCGMCGEKLSEGTAEDPGYNSQTAEGAESTFSDSFPNHRFQGGYRTTSNVEREARPIEPYVQYDERDELARLRRITEGGSSNTSDFDWDLEASPLGHRHIYLAVGVIVVVLALIYVAWRGSHASQSAHHDSAAPPVALNEPERVPPANEDAPAATALRTQPPATPPANDGAENTRHQDAAREPTRAATQPPPDEKKSAETRPVASGNGAEELALAQRYLSGGTGLQRNSAEAAQWLWKSVAKHNAEAPLLLADLYLRGDGVSKNCEQARVLLDSAARKGTAGAGERLRNLQAACP